MSSLAQLPLLAGFFSYSRADDEDSGGKLSQLRQRIQAELRGQLGRTREDFKLFQDKTAIAHGKLWEEEIKSGIAEAVFFIPIITPTAVRSQYCKFEFSAFLAREKELGRNDLVFPILYIPVPALADGRWREDPLLLIIGNRQYEQWQHLRHLDASSTEFALRIDKFCANIAKAMQRSWVSPQERQEAEARQRDEDERRRQEKFWQVEARRQDEEQRGLEEEKRRAAKEEQRGRRSEKEPQHGPRPTVASGGEASSTMRRTLAGSAIGVLLLLLGAFALYQNQKVEKQHETGLATQQQADAAKAAAAETAKKQNADEERQRQADAVKRKAEGDEQQRLADLQAEEMRKAKPVAEAEAKAVAEAEAKRKAEEAEQQRQFQNGDAYASAGNYLSARMAYETAAKSGHAMSMFRLGELLAAGKGGSRDIDAALQWFEKSASAGYKPAMTLLACAYSSSCIHEVGSHPNVNRARYWYEQLVAVGDAGAASTLALRYENDPVKAAELLLTYVKLGGDWSVAPPVMLPVAKINEYSFELAFDPSPEKTPSSIVLLSNLDIGVRRAIQTLLIRSGHLTGRVDGNLGPATKRALDAWKVSSGTQQQ